MTYPAPLFQTPSGGQRLTFNQVVTGSIPVGLTKFLNKFIRLQDTDERGHWKIKGVSARCPQKPPQSSTAAAIAARWSRRRVFIASCACQRSTRSMVVIACSWLHHHLSPNEIGPSVPILMLLLCWKFLSACAAIPEM